MVTTCSLTVTRGYAKVLELPKSTVLKEVTLSNLSGRSLEILSPGLAFVYPDSELTQYKRLFLPARALKIHPHMHTQLWGLSSSGHFYW
jgi:hypothetical protein